MPSFVVGTLPDLSQQWIGAERSARLWTTLQVVEREWVALGRRPTVSMQPDLLFRAGSNSDLAGDVKYKLTGSGFARNPDSHQLLACATALQVRRGILI